MSDSVPKKSGVLVGRAATVRSVEREPAYFTAAHRRFVGQTGRIHAIVASGRADPLVKVGFGEPQRIVFFRLSDLDVDRERGLPQPVKHGARGSHLPRA